jgi:hypothetical protein
MWQDDKTGRTPYRWRHHLLLLAGSVLLYRDPTTLGPPVGPWVTVQLSGLKL